MKYRLSLLCTFAVVVAAMFTGHAQSVFWSEDFGTGCNQGTVITAYPGPNGAWSSLNTGVNANNASVWFISAAENGNEPGQCGSGCGNDRTLHMGSVSIFGLPADPGAAYYEGLAGFCFLLPCGATDKRAQSPVINCSAYDGITLEFDYIEGGNLIDNATLWYFNGSAWSQLADMPKTFSGTCTPQGLWTHYSIALPASANNNPNVRIGFRWINNEDGNATDPSFAADDIKLSVVGDTEPPIISGCPADPSLEGCEVALPDYTAVVTMTDNADPTPLLVQEPPAGTLISGSVSVTLTATDEAGNQATCIFQVSAFESTVPSVNCPEGLLIESVADGLCYHVLADYAQVLVISDNCDPDPVFVQDPPPGTQVIAGESVSISIVVTDASGNATACSLALSVTDAQPPLIVCAPLVSDTLATALETEIQVEVPVPAVEENCLSYTLTNSYNGSPDASGMYSAGLWEVTFTATDAAGNQATCITQVEVMPVPCCAVDFDCNYVVNVSDLLAFMVYFGTFGDTADFNGDGSVNISDLLVFMSSYGLFCP
jgi:hypothetical protein